MTWLAQLLADEDFRNGATVIVTVVAGGAVVIAVDKVLIRRFVRPTEGPEQAIEAAGIDITHGPDCPDIVADSDQQPHYVNGCGCADCQPDDAPAISRAVRRPSPYARWSPTDAEIEQFINGPKGGTQ